MHATLALLEVDRIRRKIPVYDGVAVRMKVQALLPDRGAGEDEWCERRVERVANRFGRCLLAGLVLGRLSVGARKAGAHGMWLEPDRLAGDGDLLGHDSRAPRGSRSADRLGDLACPTFGNEARDGAQ